MDNGSKLKFQALSQVKFQIPNIRLFIWCHKGQSAAAEDFRVK